MATTVLEDARGAKVPEGYYLTTPDGFLRRGGKSYTQKRHAYMNDQFVVVSCRTGKIAFHVWKDFDIAQYKCIYAAVVGPPGSGTTKADDLSTLLKLACTKHKILGLD